MCLILETLRYSFTKVDDRYLSRNQCLANVILFSVMLISHHEEFHLSLSQTGIHEVVNIYSVKNLLKYLQVWRTSYFWALQSFHILDVLYAKWNYIHEVLSYSVDFKTPRGLNEASDFTKIEVYSNCKSVIFPIFTIGIWLANFCAVIQYTEIILCMRSANERCRYSVTLSLISWAHTQNYPCKYLPEMRNQYVFFNLFFSDQITCLLRLEAGGVNYSTWWAYLGIKLTS